MSIVKVGNEEVDLNNEILSISHETINDFLSKYASWYRYYVQKHNDAAYIVKCYKDKLDGLLSSKFKQNKLEKECSDKMADAYAKSDEEVVKLQEQLRIAEHVKEELQSFLKSMDYAHADALQMCYNIRKEMDKIGGSSIKFNSEKKDAW
jgi:hypothetical protein